jgi:hypothetical protein
VIGGPEIAMPQIQCEHGHTIHIGTEQFLGTLTVAQLRYARDHAVSKIKAAEQSAKRVVWRVCKGAVCVANYQEEEYEAAADHVLRIYKEAFIQEAKDFIKEPYGTIRFEREIPHIAVELTTQVEYDTEWFPTK